MTSKEAVVNETEKKNDPRHVAAGLVLVLVLVLVWSGWSWLGLGLVLAWFGSVRFGSVWFDVVWSGLVLRFSSLAGVLIFVWETCT